MCITGADSELATGQGRLIVTAVRIFTNRNAKLAFVRCFAGAIELFEHACPIVVPQKHATKWKYHKNAFLSLAE